MDRMWAGGHRARTGCRRRRDPSRRPDVHEERADPQGPPVVVLATRRLELEADGQLNLAWRAEADGAPDGLV